MKQNWMQKIARFIKEHKMKKQWQMAATVMAAVVVFSTTYALILPAITLTKDNVYTSSDCQTASNSQKVHVGQMNSGSDKAAADVQTPSNATQEIYYCGFEAHTHDKDCYNDEGHLVCEETVHVHTDECLIRFTEEELALIQNVIDMIAELPTSEEAEAALEAFESENDKEGFEAYVKAIAEIAWAAHDAYEALDEELQAEVTNIDLLRELEWLWSKTILFEYPSLEADGAYVSKLNEKTSNVITDSEEEPDPMTVQNGDAIEYQFSVETDSYSDMYYSEGRVKVEFVLPFAAEEAEFDLTDMNWLDDSEGYEAAITTETRTIGDEEIECQVLTGYKHFAAEEASEEVIPGNFTGNVVVSVNEMEHNEEIAILISAAMEYNEWDGECAEHERKEKLTITTDEYKVYAPLSPEEQKVIYEAFLAEVEEAEANGLWTEELKAAAEELLERVQEAYAKGEISEEYCQELIEKLNELINTEFCLEAQGEMIEGTNWIRLRDSGWFEEYEEYENIVEDKDTRLFRMAARHALLKSVADEDELLPSDVQVVNPGGSRTSDDGEVTVSKTIKGTELENVFDITLTVQTKGKIEEVYEDPNMAVVIVMDISNTMNENFGTSGTDTKYKAAMEAAEEFVRLFSENTTGISKIGYVTFNTHSQMICKMQSCVGETQKSTFINAMRKGSGDIINNYEKNANGYCTDPDRYTNIEAGLKRANSMLSKVDNPNKYVIFLSDGLPTTYVKEEYTGYVPSTSSITSSQIGKDGYFYDKVYGRVVEACNYSDKGALRAAQAAATLRGNGVKVFSIGAGLNKFSGTYNSGLTGMQMIKDQFRRAKEKKISTIDNNISSADFANQNSVAIGSLNDAKAFETWLGDVIGSGYNGYYYETTNRTGLIDAYKGIFAKIKKEVESSSQADWVSKDPMPKVDGATETVEFIGFYDKNGTLVFSDLDGDKNNAGIYEENTATYDSNKTHAISWDLKKSKYQSDTQGTVTTYVYQLVYKVRLKNEKLSFVERDDYLTNDTTTLSYRFVKRTDGIVSGISELQTVEFPIPEVEGYLGELTFTKLDTFGRPVENAEFTLSHDTDPNSTNKCAYCRGDGKNHVTISNEEPFKYEIEAAKATSDANGIVKFTRIPSGHKYTLVETRVPNGYVATNDEYTVEVAYDNVTVKVNGSADDWEGSIVNHTSYELPQTGGPGTWFYTLSGLLLTVGTMIFGFIQRREQERRAM